ncbi:hypothetical protein [Catellatospora citrea]|uniref:hypothetical protein n=1 Tax=Catellatospora citrea TaxID=53366 RepID=UPI0011C34A94|nr:hypothetical protein [Catellatospora citrea]
MNSFRFGFAAVMIFTRRRFAMVIPRRLNSNMKFLSSITGRTRTAEQIHLERVNLKPAVRLRGANESRCRLIIGWVR